MRVLEVFFDYICPFCLRGHDDLMEVLPEFTDVEIKWRPCEAHPRPEEGRHSDLLLQGMFFAEEAGADLNEYHRRMYKAALQDRIDIEDIDSIAGALRGLLDEKALKEALRSGKYADIQRQHNTYAFQESGVWAVPSYRMAGQKLDSVLEVGVSKEQIRDFLLSAK